MIDTPDVSDPTRTWETTVKFRVTCSPCLGGDELKEVKEIVSDSIDTRGANQCTRVIPGIRFEGTE